MCQVLRCTIYIVDTVGFEALELPVPPFLIGTLNCRFFFPRVPERGKIPQDKSPISADQASLGVLTSVETIFFNPNPYLALNLIGPYSTPLLDRAGNLGATKHS